MVLLGRCLRRVCSFLLSFLSSLSCSLNSFLLSLPSFFPQVLLKIGPIIVDLGVFWGKDPKAGLEEEQVWNSWMGLAGESSVQGGAGRHGILGVLSRKS